MELMDFVVKWFAFVPAMAIKPDEFDTQWLPLLWSFITYSFVHANWTHFLNNFFWLVCFSIASFANFGWRLTITAYFMSVIAGALAFAASSLPETAALVGSSAGVSGLAGVFCYYLGKKNSRLMAICFAFAWIGSSVLMPFIQNAFISWQSHFGGFVAGLITIIIWKKIENRKPKAIDNDLIAAYLKVIT